MPLVLHILPPDAALTCAGLEEWVDVGPGFVPRAAWTAPAGRWAMLAVSALPPATSREPTWRRLWVPADAGPWKAALAGFDVIHLHDAALAADAARGAKANATPLVASWPAGVAWDPAAAAADAILVPSPAEGARLAAAGAPAARLRVAPPPLVAMDAAVGTAPSATARWVAAAEAHDPRGLERLLRAWAIFAAEHPAAPPLRLLAGGALPDPGPRLLIELGLADRVEVAAVLGAGDARAAIASADLGVFAGAGMGWAARVAASAGLPLVLGRVAGEAEGWRDQEDALLAEADPAALAKRMAFLGARPHLWPKLRAASARIAGTWLGADRARGIPPEVYRGLLAGRRP